MTNKDTLSSGELAVIEAAREIVKWDARGVTIRKGEAGAMLGFGEAWHALKVAVDTLSSARGDSIGSSGGDFAERFKAALVDNKCTSRDGTFIHDETRKVCEIAAQVFGSSAACGNLPRNVHDGKESERDVRERCAALIEASGVVATQAFYEPEQAIAWGVGVSDAQEHFAKLIRATPLTTEARYSGDGGKESERCPSCDSTHPHLHPAVQFEGEVETCTHDFHLRETPQNTPEYRAAVLAKRDLLSSKHVAPAPTQAADEPKESADKARIERLDTIETCAKVMDAEAQQWIDAKAALIPINPDNAVSLATHDRYFNYIENAKRCAKDIRALTRGKP